MLRFEDFLSQNKNGILFGLIIGIISSEFISGFVTHPWWAWNVQYYSIPFIALAGFVGGLVQHFKK